MRCQFILALAAVFSTVSSDVNAAQIDPAYEYVIVGSGPGGGPLACRLAIAGHKVLLIDAGDDQRGNINYKVPGLHARVVEDPNLQWNFYVRQYSDDNKAFKSNKAVWTTPNRLEYIGNQPPPGSTYKGILYPRAGTLGGCAAHNALITITPHENDWRYIQSLTGDNSWDPLNMRKYFEKIERKRSFLSRKYDDGWLTVEFAPVILALQDFKIIDWLVAAGTHLASSFVGQFMKLSHRPGERLSFLQRNPNVFTPKRDSNIALYQIPLATKDQTRFGPADFVADTIAAGHPLTFLPNTLVTKVMFDTKGSQPRAIGVKFLQGKSLYSADPRYNKNNFGIAGEVRASKEVIISGGAFNTPQILKLSGIGPREELRKFNISVVVDLPGVGNNMQDRYENAINFNGNTDFKNLEGCTFNFHQPDECLRRWQTRSKLFKAGSYSSNGIVAVAFVKSSGVANHTDFPTDQDLVLFGGPVNFSGYFPRWDRAALADHKHWTWVVLKAHTRNRAGTVKLRSADPRDTPEINFHYFSEGSLGWELDKKAVVEGLKMTQGFHKKLIVHKKLRFVQEWPVLNDDLDSYAELHSWGHHASCSCPIGADGDPMAVLDSNFRVRCTQNLRVVDASVFPRIPGLFIAVPTMQLSEKAADVILSGI